MKCQSMKILKKAIIGFLICTILIISIVILVIKYGYPTYLLWVSQPKPDNYIDCTDDLSGLADYYNRYGIGRMQIQSASLYDTGERGAVLYIFGVNNIPEANSAALVIREYFENYGEQFYDNKFVLNIYMMTEGPVSEDEQFAAFEICFDLSEPDCATVSLGKGTLINSINLDSIPLNVSIVHIYSSDELTDEELETIESNYPNAYLQ